jgi:hypothetical protein
MFSKLKKVFAFLHERIWGGARTRQGSQTEPDFLQQLPVCPYKNAMIFQIFMAYATSRL